MTAPTSQHLADVLRSAGFTELATRAEQDEFHDFFGPHALPGLMLADLLRKIIIDDRRSEKEREAAHMIRLRLIDGEFDADDAEADQWASSEEGQEAFRQLNKEQLK